MKREGFGDREEGHGEVCGCGRVGGRVQLSCGRRFVLRVGGGWRLAAGGRYFSGTCNLVARIDIEMVCLSSLGAVLSRVFGICAGVTPRSQCALKLFC